MEYYAGVDAGSTYVKADTIYKFLHCYAIHGCHGGDGTRRFAAK